MSKDELLDLVNEKDEVIGTVWKSVANKNPKKIHREVAVIIFDESRRVLIQQRSFRKALEPGKWMLSAAGHVLAGEDPGIAAKRELIEELGITTRLKFFGKEWNKRENESRIFYMYFGKVRSADKIKINKDETEKYKWIDITRLKDYPYSSYYRNPLKVFLKNFH